MTRKILFVALLISVVWQQNFAQNEAAPIVTDAQVTPAQPIAEAKKTVTSEANTDATKVVPKPEPIVETTKTAAEPKVIAKSVGDEQLKLEHHLKLLEDEANITLNFNNASLQNFADQIAEIFGYSFLSDDDIKSASAADQQQPQQQPSWGGGAGQQQQRTNKPLIETKISFHTNAPLSRRKAWNLFTTFLEMSGWSLAPTNDPKIWRITATPTANRRPLPTFISTPIDGLPDSDQRVRYVFFLQNTVPKMMEGLINTLKSPTAQVEAFAPAKALIITDAAYNIRALVRIMQELDKSISPQTISIVKLNETDASEVAKLLGDLQKKDEPSPFFAPKKEGSSTYFSPEVSLVADPRTNTIILVGPQEAVSVYENFIKNRLDVIDSGVQSPLRPYQLDYVPAKQLADLLTQVLSFGAETGVGKSGGVRAGVKYFGNVSIQAEEQTNQLIIRAGREDFEHISRFIREIDKRQPQIALEVMIFSIDIEATRTWGIQWNSKKERMVNVQMSGFFGSGIQTKTIDGTQVKSIISDLINLATATGVEAGTTLLTLGKEAVYAIMGVLSQNSLTRLLANPFVLTTNKYRAIVATSEQRQAQNQNIINAAGPTAGYGTFDAKLEVGITPQINSSGIINLDVDVRIESFLNDADTKASASNANKQSDHVHTNANVANREILAIGGLTRKRNTISRDRLPFLSKIPIIGSIFRNEAQKETNQSVIIFITPTIIKPNNDEVSNAYTRNKAKFFVETIDEIEREHESSAKDPVHRWFFQGMGKEFSGEIRNFVTPKQKQVLEDVIMGEKEPETYQDLDNATPQTNDKPTTTRALTNAVNQGVGA